MKKIYLPPEKMLPRVIYARLYDTKTDLGRTTTTKPRKAETYEMSLYLSGNGSVTVNGELHNINVGDVRFVRPLDINYSKKDFSCLTIYYDFGESNGVYYNEILNAIPVFFHPSNNLNYLFNEVVKEFVSNEKQSRIKQNALVLEILCELYDFCTNVNKCPESVKLCVKYIDEHFQEKITLDKLGEIAAYSPLHVLRLFKESLKKTPHDYLTEVRLAHARELLLGETDLSIEKVSYMCGFNSESHFKSLFKSYFNVTVGKFKKHSKTV